MALAQKLTVMPSRSNNTRPGNIPPDSVPGPKADERSHPVLKPRPAGTLLILDKRDGRPHVLMGRRHKAHTFMPGVFVFPGGRVDRPDNHAPYNADLTDATMARLMASGQASLATDRRARAFALAAIRETYEEAGMLIGRSASTPIVTSNTLWKPFLGHGQLPDLAALRYVARAVTPPGLVRRYDTRFFTVSRAAISAQLPDSPTNELSDLTWVPFDRVDQFNIPRITGLILQDVGERIVREGTLDLSDNVAVPVYSMRYGKRRRVLV